MIRKRFPWLIALAVLGVIGYVVYCKISRGRVELMTRPVAEPELVGEWYLSPETVELLVAQGLDRVLFVDRDNCINIKQDGMVGLRLVLPVFSGPSAPRVDRYALEGRWNLLASARGSHTQNILEMEFKHSLVDFRLFVGEDKAGLQLWRYLDDPDDVWERMCFIKRQKID